MDYHLNLYFLSTLENFQSLLSFLFLEVLGCGTHFGWVRRIMLSHLKEYLRLADFSFIFFVIQDHFSFYSTPVATLVAPLQMHWHIISNSERKLSPLMFSEKVCFIYLFFWLIFRMHSHFQRLCNYRWVHRCQKSIGCFNFFLSSILHAKARTACSDQHHFLSSWN